jgi:hypothetical protein
MTSQPPAVTGVLSLLGHAWLGFETLHGEPLFVHALRALGEALGGEPLVVVRRPDVARVAADVSRTGLAARVVAEEDWWEAAGPGHDLLVHDALCPLASAEFLAAVAARAGAGSVVAFRPVTDTVKTAVDGAIQGTIDRESLAAVTSPVLVAAETLDAVPPLADFARLVGWLRERGPVELVTAPAIARRVDDASAVNLLESIDELGRRVRPEV